MRKDFGASVNTCKTCSITARLLFFICAGKGILVFDTVGGHHFRARESSLSILPFFYSLENGESCSGMAINDLLSFISFFILSIFCLFYIFHPSYFHLIIFRVQMLTNALTSLLRVDLELNALT